MPFHEKVGEALRGTLGFEPPLEPFELKYPYYRDSQGGIRKQGDVGGLYRFDAQGRIQKVPAAPAPASRPSDARTPDAILASAGLPAAGPDPFSFLTVNQLRAIISDPSSTPEEIRRAGNVLAAGGGAPDEDGGGPSGPSAAELAIQRSQVQAQNLSTFINGTIAELTAEIDAGRLKTEQALGEFNRRLDAFAEGGKQFQGIQPYTIPRGAEYIPGFGPRGPATRVGLEPVRASPIEYDPFGMATQIVAETPNLVDIGVPSTSALQQAIEMAKRFI